MQSGGDSIPFISFFPLVREWRRIESKDWRSGGHHVDKRCQEKELEGSKESRDSERNLRDWIN